MLDIRQVLAIPAVYNFFQEIIGAQRVREKFFHDFILSRLSDGDRMLEVGCGPGNNCGYIPSAVTYVGCDMDEKYIEHAKDTYGHRFQFFAAPVGHLRTLTMERFDIVLALNLLHHLSDNQVFDLMDEVTTLLKEGGIFITGDPCYADGQSAIEHFITSCDRGRFVRRPDQYESLLKNRFSHVEVQIEKNKMLIPNTGTVLVATV